MTSPAVTVRLAAIGVAVAVHATVAGLALWMSTVPRLSVTPPDAISISIAPLLAEEKAVAPAPEPEPEPEPEPVPQPDPLPVPEPQALPEPLPEPEPVLVSSAAPAPGDAVAPPTPTEEPPPPAPANPEAETRAATYFGKLLAWLDRHKHYPRAARKNRVEGVVYLHFVMDRSGKVLSYQIDKSSGAALLDQAALDMIRRADPLPPIPDDIPDETLDLVVPVEFFMRSRR